MLSYYSFTIFDVKLDDIIYCWQFGTRIFGLFVSWMFHTIAVHCHFYLPVNLFYWSLLSVGTHHTLLSPLLSVSTKILTYSYHRQRFIWTRHFCLKCFCLVTVIVCCGHHFCFYKFHFILQMLMCVAIVTSLKCLFNKWWRQLQWLQKFVLLML